MVELYHKIYGTGEPIIILHGLFGMSDNWTTFAKRLAENNMVILIDIRDHGRSPHTDSFSYQEAAADVAKLCQDNWIYEAVVIGHSMGGKVAMQLAYEHAEMVNKLVIVDIAPVTYSGGHEVIIEALSNAHIDKATSRRDIEEEISENIKDLGIVRFLMKNLARKKEGGFRWKMNLSLLRKHYQDILAQPPIRDIDIPTIFIKGSRSDYITKESEQVIKEIFTDTKVISIEDAGHWVHAEQAERMLMEVKAFIEKT